MLNKISLILLILTISFATLSGENLKFDGIVLNSETNKNVPLSLIKIVELSKYITCDNNGKFIIPDLQYGTYTFVINHIGFKENISTITVDSNSDKLFVFYLIPKNIELDPVIISDYQSFSKFDDLAELTNVLKGKELQKRLGLTLASTLKNEAGLSMRSMGPAPSRPVIRGLGSSRVLISEDGIKTTDLSATSPDHAVTIDPFSVTRVEVLRGPKILLQTPTTIGGVVNVVKENIPELIHDDLTGQIGLFGETVNKGYLGSFALEIPFDPIAVKAEFSSRKTNDVDTPAGVLKNSDSENRNINLGTSYIFENGFVGASFNRFDLDYGVPGGFVGAHPNGVNISIYKNQYNFQSKYNFLESSLKDVKIDFTRAFYRHKEFESSGALGSEFRVINYLGSVKLHHDKISFLEHGTIGISSEYRDFDIGGFVFSSPSKSLNLSAHIFETYSYKKLSFEFGARYDYDKISPQFEKPESNIGFVRERVFNNYSFSLSVLYQQSEYVYFGANISKSSRVPTIEELYSEGPHLAAYSYEIGNPDLNSERGLGGELFIYHQFKDLFFNFTLFGNDLKNYIIPRSSGEINYATFLPIYKTEGVEAKLYGFESRIDWNATNIIQFSNTLSLTRGEFRNGGSLPQIPPIKGFATIKYKTDILNFGISGEWALKQYNIDEFEESTEGYFVLNLFMQYSLVFEHFTSNFSLNIDNLFNSEYRNHLSRVKSILPEAGRNFRLSYKMYFHL